MSEKNNRKRSFVENGIQLPCCPICGLALRSNDIESHLKLEIEKLDKISRTRRTSTRDKLSRYSPSFSPSTGRTSEVESPATPITPEPSPAPETQLSGNNPDVASKARYGTFLRVRANRQQRLAAKFRKKRRAMEETTCPVCNLRVTGTADELNVHAEQCLKKAETRGAESESVDVEGCHDSSGEQYEEYTWAGQTRIRASSMLSNRALNDQRSAASCSHGDEDDTDLVVVDGDDAEIYGKTQYRELDVIPCSSEEPREERERLALRGAFLQAENLCTRESGDVGDIRYKSPSERSAGSSNSDTSPSHDDSIPRINGDLDENKIKSHLETTNKDQTLDKPKCLICMEAYTKPLASIQCWHVYCEECWLRTLGAKKLCPQCNVITSPSDLRRIFI